jgi:hypothetical protein
VTRKVGAECRTKGSKEHSLTLISSPDDSPGLKYLWSIQLSVHGCSLTRMPIVLTFVISSVLGRQDVTAHVFKKSIYVCFDAVTLILTKCTEVYLYLNCVPCDCEKLEKSSRFLNKQIQIENLTSRSLKRNGSLVIRRDEISIMGSKDPLSFEMREPGSLFLKCRKMSDRAISVLRFPTTLRIVSNRA